MLAICLPWWTVRGGVMLLGALLWVAFGASVARAQNASPTPESDPWGENGAKRAHSSTGAGYDPHSGAAKRDVPDLHVPGSVGAFPLEWIRHWSSVEVYSRVADLPTAFASGGWSHSYRWLASYDQEAWEPPEHGGAGSVPTATPFRHLITLAHPDGATVAFQHYTSSAEPSDNWPEWITPPGVTDHIEMRDAQASEFWIHRADGSTIKFQAFGAVAYGYWRACEIVDPHGLRTTLSYDPNPARASCLTRVTDESGRFLSITWQDIPGYGVPVIYAVQSGARLGGTDVLSRTVTYHYSPLSVSGENKVALTAVRYVDDLGPGQDAWAQYQYATEYQAYGYTLGCLLLSYANDPRFEGAMTRVRYTYRLGPGGVDPWTEVSPPRSQGIQDPVHFGAIEEERSGETGARVSHLTYGIYVRTEKRGDGPSRTFSYGEAMGVEPGGVFIEPGNGGGYWLPPEANPRLKPPWDLGKLTDFRGNAQFFRTKGTVLTKIWDFRLLSTAAEYDPLTEQVTKFTHLADGSSQLFDRANAGSSPARDASVLPNPYNCWLFSRRDELGHVTTYTRDSRRRITRVDYPGGVFETFAYNALNQVTTHQLASGAVQTFTYDARGLLLSAANNVDATESAAYAYYGPGDHPEWLDRVKTVKTGRSNAAGAAYAVLMEYNGCGQVTKVHYPAVSGGCGQGGDPTVTYAYDLWGNCTSITDELGHWRTFTFDEYRRCTNMTEQLDALPWNGQGSAVASRAWDWIYDRGIVGYPAAPAAAHTDRQWRIQIEPVFNAAGDRRASVQYFDENQRVAYAQTGWWQAAGAPLGYLSYDYGQPTSITESHYFTYDVNGNKTSFRDPLNRLTTYAYDSRNRLWKTTDPIEPGATDERVTTSLYDYAGNKTSVQKPDGGTQTWGPYDPFGQPAWWQDENGGRTEFEYQWGPMKKLARVYDARQVAEGKAKGTQFSFDGLGRATVRLFADGTSETLQWSNGAPFYTTNRWGQGQSHFYDARGREILSQWSGAAAPQIARCWDDAGRLVSLSNVDSTLSYTYDAAGQKLTETQALAGAGSGTLTYRRYPDGAVAHVDYPNGVRIRRDWNARGQLVQVRQADGAFNPMFELVTYTLNSDGKVASQTHGNWMKTNLTYEERGLISSVIHTKREGGAGSPFRNIGSRAYRRDDVGRIVCVQKGSEASYNAMESGRWDFFAYDWESQLVYAGYEGEMTSNGYVNPQRSQTFAYDPMGSRTETFNVPAGVGTRPWDVRPNGLNQQWVAHYWAYLYYDNNSDPVSGPTKGNGCVTAFAGYNFAFNALNQMTAANNVGATPYTFAYDPLGRLVKRTASGVATFFFWDDWSLVQEGPATGPTPVSKIYVHGARVDEIIARFDYTIGSNQAWHYLHYDARGHCTHLTDFWGNLAEQYTYDAFGRPYVFDRFGSAQTQSAFDNRFLFTGREWLKDLQIYDYRHRHYHPELGRFLQPDPRHFEAGDFNLYRYCHNDPINKQDPFGLEEKVWLYREAADIPGGRMIDKLDMRHEWVVIKDNGNVVWARGMGNANGVPGANGQSSPDLPGSKTYVVDHSGRENAPNLQKMETAADPNAVRDSMPLGQYTGRWVPYMNDCNTLAREAIRNSTSPVADPSKGLDSCLSPRKPPPKLLDGNPAKCH